MSAGQTPRNPLHFPRMKHRAAGRLRGPTASMGGGYICDMHGIRWFWGKVGAAEYEMIEEDIAEHEDYHRAWDDE